MPVFKGQTGFIKPLENITQGEKDQALFNVLTDMSAIDLMDALDLQKICAAYYHETIEDEIREMRGMKESAE